jgi:predicted AlkP superfamily phosphohydrolase/phosphomutase
VRRRGSKQQKLVMSKKRRVLILGLDCAEPSLVFDQYSSEMPNLSRLAREGAWGKLQSVIPASTVPAWACALTSQDPGQLGIYGFQNRADHSYDGLSLANARTLTQPSVSAYIGHKGKQSFLVGVPPSFPPKPIIGGSVGCFLSPNTAAAYTYPRSLQDEIGAIVPNYRVDVPQFQTDDKRELLGQIYEMTEGHFKLTRHLVKTKPWDFMMFVEIGPDRLHHGFWKYHDPTHPKHEPGNSLSSSIHDYYVWLDRQIGSLLELLDDNTCVMVMSDHGAKSLRGGIRLNEWLFDQGYLVLREKPNSVTPFGKVKPDWAKTRAWATGGYYGRIYLNVQGREPQGLVSRRDYEQVRDTLIEQLSAIRAPDGKPLATRIYKPKHIYRATNNVPPDLIVMFDDLNWRVTDALGAQSLYASGQNLEPDDANHTQQGMFIYYDPQRRLKGRELKNISLYDVAPTVLNEFGQDVPPHMIGKVIRPESVYEELAPQSLVMPDPLVQTLFAAL